MRKFRMVHETPSHFIMHNGDAHFHIAKKGLDAEMHGKIAGLKGQDMPAQKLSDGGRVTPDQTDRELADKYGRITPENKVMENEGRHTPENAKKYADGGKIELDPEKVDKFKKGFGFSEGGEVAGNDEWIMNSDGTMRKKTSEDYPQKKSPSSREPASVTSSDPKKEFEEGFKKSFGFSDGGAVPEESGDVPQDLSRNPQQAKEMFSAGAKQAKDVMSVPVNDYGTNEMTPPPSITYNFYHGTIPPKNAQHFAAGGMAVDEKAGMDPNQQPLPPGETLQGPTQTIPELGGNVDWSQLPSIPSMDQLKKGTEQMPEFGGSGVLAAANNAYSPAPAVPMELKTALPEDGVSFVEKAPAPPAPLPGSKTGEFPTGGLDEFNRGEGLMQQGIKDSAQHQADAASGNEKLYKDFAEAQAKRNELAQKKFAELDKQNQELHDSILSKNIDPNRLWNSASTGGKISTILGLIFGGMGSGLTHQPSQAAAMLENAIKNDIDAQKTDKTGAISMYKEGLQRYRDVQSAEQFATMQANTVLAAQIQQSAAKLGTKQAFDLAKQATGELMQKNAGLKKDLALKDASMEMLREETAAASAPSESSGGIDPQVLRKKILTGRIPKEEVAPVMKEYNDYMKTQHAVTRTEQLFEELPKLATATGRFLPHGAPTTREETKKYDAAVDVYLDKLTKDLAGRVTPQSAALIKNTLPVWGDEPDTIAFKKKQVLDIIKGDEAYGHLLLRQVISPNDPLVRTSADQHEYNKKFEFKPK